MMLLQKLLKIKSDSQGVTFKIVTVDFCAFPVA